MRVFRGLRSVLNSLSGEIKMLKKFLLDESGAELAEYAVAVALLVAIGVVVYNILGQGIFDANSATGTAIKDAENNVSVGPAAP